ncbi:RES family NAD+ phosphorylase [Metallibacterium scheffleri]
MWLIGDVELIQQKGRIGFFHYGPRMWMIGGIGPLKALQNSAQRDDIIQRILSEYPVVSFAKDGTLYRLRLNPATPIDSCEYDSPPDHLLGRGRLDAQDHPVLYCAQDIEGCVHECRVTVEDELYIATLHPARPLKLLDLTELLLEEDTTEFESLDLAVHMLFYAPEHSYPISRAIAIAAMKSGFDGVVYPSYSSQVRSGLMPAETVGYGISIRRAARYIPRLTGHAKTGVYPNVALFGRPVRDGIVEIACINRLILHKASYDIRFGPVISH